ncbi:hypothetical protein B0H17DRAFT_921603 [Mycena rosella]|uniref:Uncharacterized protein n=1 Tax=Mycena rosella TaxID=1033263 RepID=A0AAD7M6N7_MYCRO|nr:hypothetical protein B0H17DRAFT_921603 [Mycena rosella]
MSSSFAPPGESAYDLWIERSNLNGVILSAVAYGILFTVTFQTLLLFLQRPKSKIPWGSVTYICVMFILASIGLGGNAKFNQMTFIDDRNYPGGPNAFTIDFYATPVNLSSFISYTVMSWFADGMVLWRFNLIWNHNYWLSAFPALMLAGSIASSIALVISVTNSGNTFWASKSVQIGIAYWSLSIALNIILTVLIASRIWFLRYRIRRSLGSQHSGQYLSVTAMLVESAALYAVWSTVFLVCYARNTPFQNILLPPLGQIQGIAPLLILFRVAQGRGWSQSTVSGNYTQPSRIPVSEVTVNGAGSRNIEMGLKVNMRTDRVTHWDDGKGSSV